jgi:hypothetical protein
MSSRRKPLAALAAATAALGAAVPAASASAATPRAPTVDPTVCQLLTISGGPSGLTKSLGGASLVSTIAQSGASVGCPGSASASAPAPARAPQPRRPAGTQPRRGSTSTGPARRRH